jgi:hypothetical protein
VTLAALARAQQGWIGEETLSRLRHRLHRLDQRLSRSARPLTLPSPPRRGEDLR